jgi:release factor glutamine methyltransferase
VARIEMLLAKAGIPAARREALWLLEAATGTRSSDLLARGTSVGGEQPREALDLAGRRAAGEPLQYITGVAGFRHLELAVGPGAFIPRPETELVAERAMERLPSRGTAVDVGTGSGAIALAVAQERPDASVWATEISTEALAWARRNRDSLCLEVRLVLGDLFEGLPSTLKGRVDVVVSNPPYVRPDELASLPVDVARHEPAQALLAEDGGMGVTERLAGEASAWLRSTGWLVLEIAEAQGARVAGLLESSGYEDVSVRKDLTGRDRIAEGRSP